MNFLRKNLGLFVFTVLMVLGMAFFFISVKVDAASLYPCVEGYKIAEQSRTTCRGVHDGQVQARVGFLGRPDAGNQVMLAKQRLSSVHKLKQGLSNSLSRKPIDKSPFNK